MNYRKAGQSRDGFSEPAPMAAYRVGFHTDEHARTSADQLQRPSSTVAASFLSVVISYSSNMLSRSPSGREELPNL